MSYSDFKTLKELEKKFGVGYQINSLFSSIQPIEPSQFLLHTLSIAKLLPSTFSEKSRSENLITPILFEVFEQSQQTITVFSGCTLVINNELTGICDYVISKKRRLLTLDAPIVCIVEAKQRSIDEGLAQAGAELIAATLFNQQEQYDIDIVYGAVTNGIEWKFLSLQHNILRIDDEFYFSTGDNLKILLGIFQIILTS
jgi:hypothetical protein